MPSMNEWRHYLVTYDVSMGAAQRKFYLDGHLFGSDSNDTLEDSSLNFMLGKDVLAIDHLKVLMILFGFGVGP